MSTTLFPSTPQGDVPLAARQQKLTEYFHPAPGSLVKVLPELTKNLHSKSHIELLHGLIDVNPPKGFCFTITLHEDHPDQTVCKPTRLMFRLSHIDGDSGKIRWKIRTGTQDFGTILEWNTPHRVARVIAASKDFENDAENVFLERCERTTTESKDLKFDFFPFLKRKWSIVIPKNMSKLPEPTKQEIENPTSRWKLSTRKGYEFIGDRFVSSQGSLPPMPEKSRCRFEKETSEREARLECHHTAEYTFVYIPIGC